jgi:hypothetical protein
LARVCGNLASSANWRRRGTTARWSAAIAMTKDILTTAKLSTVWTNQPKSATRTQWVISGCGRW